MKSRLGAPKAITATAHKLARLVYFALRYGWDYVDRLEEAGFQPEVIRMDAFLSADEIGRMRLAKFGEIEPLIICR